MAISSGFLDQIRTLKKTNSTVVQHPSSLVCLVECCPKDVRGKVPKTARVQRLERKVIGELCLLFLKSVFQPLL